MYARGVDGRPIFVDVADRAAYLWLLADVTARQRWYCLAYCQMGNHVHLLIETTEPNLACGMHRLHGAYAQRFNRRHERRGHLFERRYGCIRIETDAQLWAVVGYVARNPTEAGFADTPEQWPWSSHAATLGAAPPTWLAAARLRSHLTAYGGDPLARYRACVATPARAEDKGAWPL